MLLLLILAGFSVNAQVFTRKIDPNDPATSKVARLPSGNIPSTEFGSINLSTLQAEDAQRQEEGKPLRVAVKQNANLNLLQVGRAVESDGQRVTFYELRAPGAMGIGADFDQIQLAEGTQLFLYDAARTTLVGPITNTENTDGNHYLSDRVPGDRLIVEIREGLKAPASTVNLSGIINEYTPYGPISATFRPTATCHNDLSCAPSYQYEADGVAMILMFDGVSSFFLCSGSMLNDTRQSFRSYFLTAFHCMDFNSDLTINANESASTASWSFYFKYQSPTCSPTQDDNIYVTINGATFRSASPNSDMTLLELNRQLPQNQEITYNGWDRRTTNYTGGLFGIHHPNGSVKKISFMTNTIYSGWNGTFPDSYYRMGHISGTLEGGSSGSPLFNSDRRIIGQLIGGSGSCPVSTRTSLYGRFDLSWFGNGTNNTRLSNWLDVAGTGATVTNAATPRLEGPASFTGSATYTMNANNALTIWTVLGGEGVVSPTAGSGNRALLTALSNSSSLTVVFSVNAGQSYPITYSQVISAGTPRANRAPQAPVGGIENQRLVLNTTYDFEIPRFTDPDGDPLSYTVTGLPTGLQFFNDPEFPYIFGRTTTPGVSTIVVTATDPGGLMASAPFSITILNNRAPVAVSAVASTSVALGITGSISLASFITDADGTALTFVISGSLPPGMSRSGGTISGRPTTGGSYTITVTGTDNFSLSATMQLIINVIPVANRAPVSIGPDLSFGALQTGINYRLSIAGIFTDPEGSTVAYGVIGLPGDFTLTGANSLTPAILGGRVDPATISLTVTGTDPQGAVGTTRLTMIFTRPVSTSLSLLLPTYDCNTGTIIFNTAGGNGTPITYTAVGVQRSSPTAFFGTVEPGLRADPKPILITATQNGVTARYVFDLEAYCRGLAPVLPPNPVNPPSPTGPLTIQQPTYNCQSGVITFNTSGGNDSPITFQAVGVQLSSPTSITGTLEPGLRADPKSIVITATQNGMSVSITFNLGAYCSGSTPPVVPPSTPPTTPPTGGSLSLTMPTYVCTTGVITINTAGGNGTTITYTAVGVQRASATSNTGVVEPGLRGDPKPLLITATQSGITTSLTFNFGAFCAGTARVASAELGGRLSVRVLGNPTNGDVVSLEVRGAEGKSLSIETIDAAGQLQSEQRVKQAGAVETVRAQLGRSAGVYLVQVQAGAERQTVRVVKGE